MERVRARPARGDGAPPGLQDPPRRRPAAGDRALRGRRAPAPGGARRGPCAGAWSCCATGPSCGPSSPPGCAGPRSPALNRADVQDGWAGQALITGKGEKERVIFFDDGTLERDPGLPRGRGPTATPPCSCATTPGGGRPARPGATTASPPRRCGTWSSATPGGPGCRPPPTPSATTRPASCSTRGPSSPRCRTSWGTPPRRRPRSIYAHYETAHLREAFDRFSVPAEERAQARDGAGPRRPGV